MLPRAWASLLPGTILFITMASLTWHAAMPLTNTDTYFHLRFGHEFLDGGWTLRDPGSVSSFGTNDWVPTQWLPQVVMAQLEDWFGLAGVAWFQGLLHLGPGRDVLGGRPPLVHPAGAAPSSSRRR